MNADPTLAGFVLVVVTVGFVLLGMAVVGFVQLFGPLRPETVARLTIRSLGGGEGNFEGGGGGGGWSFEGAGGE